MLLRFPLFLLSRHRTKPFRELTQGYYALTILLLVALYTLTIVVAVIDLVWSRVAGHPTQISSVQSVVVLLSALAIFTPTYRQMLNAAAVDWAASALYVMPSPVRARIGGQVRKVIGEVSSGRQDGKVHLLSYSFGAIVALDSVFPKTSTGLQGLRIGRLFTVGCPFDFLRLFHRRYFEDRVSGRISRWINIYVPSDILGSNFRRDNEPGPAQLAIGGSIPQNVVHNPEESLAAFSIFRLSAFRAHEAYWGGEGEPNCFSIVVQELVDEIP
jgi:hypothetical protein